MSLICLVATLTTVDVDRGGLLVESVSEECFVFVLLVVICVCITLFVSLLLVTFISRIIICVDYLSLVKCK